MKEKVFTHITDTYALDLSSKTLFDFNDHTNFYAYAYLFWDFSDMYKKNLYQEIGIRGDWVSCIVAIGEETICFCMLNATTGAPVRQLVIPFVLFEKLILQDGNFENKIRIKFNIDNYIDVIIPKYAKNTLLKHQNGMRKKIIDGLEYMNRRKNRREKELSVR